MTLRTSRRKHQTKSKTVKKRDTKRRKMSKRSRKNRGGMIPLRNPFFSYLPSCNPNYNNYDNYGDAKNILDELKQRNELDAANSLKFNCSRMKKYMLFWDKNKDEIIEYYKLGPQIQGKRRLIDFIVKMYKKEPLSPSLEQKWNLILNPPLKTNYRPTQRSSNNPFVYPKS